MNTFECRSCQRRFVNTKPSCPSGSNHIVALVKTSSVQMSPMQVRSEGAPLVQNTEASLRRHDAAADTPLAPGAWTERDREECTQTWMNACLHHLNANNFSRYTRIIERRDFYRWFYKYSIDQGYETRWALAASIVATGAHEVAIMNPGLEDLGRMVGTVGNELQGMMREGNQVIFDNVFPKLRALLKRTLDQRRAARQTPPTDV